MTPAYPPLFQTRYIGPERSNHDLCRTIEKKWRECGYPQVRAWIDTREARGKCPLTGNTIVKKVEIIRSNLVNGLPIGPRVKEAA